MLFWPKLLFLKGISKVICSLVIYQFLEGKKTLLQRMVKSTSSI